MKGLIWALYVNCKMSATALLTYDRIRAGIKISSMLRTSINVFVAEILQRSRRRSMHKNDLAAAEIFTQVNFF